jgi:hypothetical protein
VYVARIAANETRERLLEIIMREWEDNIKTKLTNICQQNMDCIRLALDREK